MHWYSFAPFTSHINSPVCEKFVFNQCTEWNSGQTVCCPSSYFPIQSSQQSTKPGFLIPSSLFNLKGLLANQKLLGDHASVKTNWQRSSYKIQTVDRLVLLVLFDCQTKCNNYSMYGRIHTRGDAVSHHVCRTHHTNFARTLCLHKQTSSVQ